MGVKLVATGGTARFLSENGIDCETASWPLDGGADSADAMIKRREVDLVINIPKNYQKDELTNGYLIRRAAADFGVPLITNIQLASRFVESISKKGFADLSCKSWREYV